MPSNRAEAQEDTLVWPPPEIEDNLALKRLVQAQRSLQKQEEAAPPKLSTAATDISTAQRQQGSLRSQSAPKNAGAAAAAAAFKPADRMAELVQGLLAGRNIVAPMLDRESIEKLRVSANHCSQVFSLSQNAPGMPNKRNKCQGNDHSVHAACP